ncbi:MAG: MgtC/SapB family protein [Syntrophomonadaceae bacterium]|nr:MgtC/SapB family protein [Syntrophomonadaceae bacterium]
MDIFEMIFKLALACVLGGLIGLERESLSRPAGLRTYTLVCVGSTLAMIVSLDIFNQFFQVSNADPGRIAAQVVSGIGFLGAGTILREGPTVSGLTTAAGLWVVACIGLAIGAGLYVPAIASSVLILFVLIYFIKIEEKFSGLRRYKGIVVVIDDRPGQIGYVGSLLGDMNVLIKDINLHHIDDTEELEMELSIDLPQNMDMSQLIKEISKNKEIKKIDVLN